MNEPPDPKTRLRQEARARRDGLDPDWRREASATIARLALTLPELMEARLISAYMSIGSEVGTGLLIGAILAAKGAVALPRVDPRSGRLEHRRVRALDPTLFRKGAFGIPEPDPSHCPAIVEPAEIGLALMPGLAFDARGHRLGMGGGHYDRFLEMAPKCPKFGLGFSVQMTGHLPALSHDVRLDGVVTERAILRF